MLDMFLRDFLEEEDHHKFAPFSAFENEKQGRQKTSKQLVLPTGNPIGYCVVHRRSEK